MDGTDWASDTNWLQSTRIKKTIFLMTENYEFLLMNHPMTQWMFDPEFNKDTAHLAPQKYDVSSFTVPYRKIFEYLTGDARAHENIQKKYLIPIDDPVQKTETLFKEDYDGFLKMSIEQRFSSVYSNSALSGKANTALLSLIFEAVRNGSQNTLSDFQLI